MPQSLKEFNTFGVNVDCSQFFHIRSIDDLNSLAYNNIEDLFILGGGSNILLCDDIHKIILFNGIKGKSIISETESEVLLHLGGGENWHETVLWTLKQGYSGLENLSLIPGTVGASPIQNIGAYGVELKDVLVKVIAFDLRTKELTEFSNKNCNFGYRDSIFKNKSIRGSYFIVGIVARLSKNIHQVNISYAGIKQSLSDRGITHPTAKDVSDVVIAIRKSKLPNPKEFGNSGSFFKNPIISKEKYEALSNKFKGIPSYPAKDGFVKIPAAWLIDYCGWKGLRIGNVGNYKKQALIIINYGNASGKEVLNHANNVRQSILDVFGISLEVEVNIIGSKSF